MAKPKQNPKETLDQLILDSQKENDELEKVLDQQPHAKKDHYHGIHHYDKTGQHDDVSDEEFSLKHLFKTNRRLATLQISMTGIILALAVALSAVDMLLEHLSVNVGGVEISMRVFDLTIIILGLPMVGFYGGLLIGLVEPWFHFLIDPDHLPIQVFLDSIGYMLVVIAFFLIYFAAFKNSPIHREPNVKKRWVKRIVPAFVLVPLLALIFAATFTLSILVGNTMPTATSFQYLIWFLIAFGFQLLRFLVMYILFVVMETKLKPVIHRYH